MGDAGETLYVILSGEVSIIGRDDDGNEIELARLGEGSFFGELALIDHENRSADARATADCEFFLIRRADFLRLLSRAPRVLADLLVGLSAKIRGNNQKVFDLLLRKERLRSEQEIDRHRSIGEMVAGVAHEINTPLGIVNHAASIIDESLRPETVAELARDEEASETLGDVCDASQLIQSNIARASKLIQSFKHLSVSHVTDTQEQVDIVEQTREVVELYRLQAQSCGLEIEIDSQVDAGQEQWLGYPGYYSQVLLNLLTNIARYAYTGGGKALIQISARDFKNEPGFQVDVRDYGAGIPDDKQDRIFEPFFTTGRDKGGSGLGLAIVRNLVNGPLGGEISLKSSESEGSVFTLVLPQTNSEAVK
jgi:signal transduction histidine kinase